MRVVGRKAFLKLPAGTIYCRGERWFFDSICIKGDSLANDWIYLNPAWAGAHDSGEAIDLLEESLATGSPFSCEDAFGRDGRFDEDDLFLIFEKDDLVALKRHLEAAIDLSQPTLPNNPR